MLDLTQELMTPDEAAGWFRRSASWIRHQPDLVRLGPAGQPLYHIQACRAYVLGRICGLSSDHLRRVQIKALAAACGIPLDNLNMDGPAPPAMIALPPATAGATPEAASRSAQEDAPRAAASAAFSSSAPS